MSLVCQQGKVVPLKGVKILAHVADLIAEVVVEHSFENTSNNPLEVVYKFPIDDAAAVYAFEATVDGELFSFEVKKKEAAKREYNEALRSGKFAGLCDDEETDVFQMRLGNFKKTVCVKLSYVCNLKFEFGNAVFFLPTTIAPRYNPKTAFFDNSVTQSSDYKVSITLECLGSVSSPSHEITVSNEPVGGVTKIVLDDVEMDRDVVFHIPLKGQGVSASYQQCPDGKFVGAATFFPSMTDAPKHKAELIFLIDTSGSMGGTAMDQAKKAMKMVLKALPTDSCFNIVSFNDNFKDLAVGVGVTWGSLIYSEENLEFALNFVDKMSACGGTEIYAPLKRVLELPSKPEYQKQVFVLTDGEVSNVDEILSLIKTHSRTTRVFSLGLGESACHHLVNSMARIGNGTAMFAAFKENLETKFLQQVRLSLEPCTAVKFDWSPLKQMPKNVGPLFKGSALTVFGFFDSVPTLIFEGKNVSFKILAEGSALARMAAKVAIQEITDLSGSGSEEEIVKLGLEFNMATKYTSFVAVGKKTVFESGTLTSVRVSNQMAHGYGGSALSAGASSASRSVTDCVRSFSFGGPTPANFFSASGPTVTASACIDSDYNECDDMSCGSPPEEPLESDEHAVVCFIVEAQKFDGSFVIDETLNEKLKMRVYVALGAASLWKTAFDEKHDGILCQTAFVVAFLELLCAKSIDVWRLSVEKARTFLRASGLEIEIDAAKKILSQ
jgi:uncharacterized protein YegL